MTPDRTTTITPTQQDAPLSSTSLNMASEAGTLPIDEALPKVDDEQQDDEKDAFRNFMTQLRSVDINETINTGLIVLVALGVLARVGTVDQDMMRGWTAAESLTRISLDNWADYSEILNAAPLQTKAITSATVYAIGDIIAQRTEGVSMGELDRPRTLRSLLAGLIGHGPLSHVWYDVSEELFTALHWNEWWGFFPKVMVDQLTWGPFWNNMYIVLLGIMKMESWETMWGDIKRTTVPLIVSGLKLWPLAHCVTYGLIPVENRLLWVDVVEIAWVTILASQASGAGAEESVVETAAVEEEVGQGDSFAA